MIKSDRGGDSSKQGSLRSRRVVLLLCGIVVLSTADLLVALRHLTTIGLAEANPIAAYLIESTGSPWALIGLKFLSVGVCVALLYRLRGYRTGEAAAWLALAILTVLSLVRHGYSRQIQAPDTMTLVNTQNIEGWLILD